VGEDTDAEAEADAAAEAEGEKALRGLTRWERGRENAGGCGAAGLIGCEVRGAGRRGREGAAGVAEAEVRFAELANVLSMEVEPDAARDGATLPATGRGGGPWECV
jgi:hypothetical protein